MENVLTERRRSRTYPAVGYTTSPVLKVYEKGCGSARTSTVTCYRTPLDPLRCAQIGTKSGYKLSGRDACVFSPVTDVLVCAECGAVSDDGDGWKAEIGMDDNDESESSSSASPAGPPSSAATDGATGGA